MRILALMMALICTANVAHAQDTGRTGLQVSIAWQMGLSCVPDGCTEIATVYGIGISGVDADSDAAKQGVQPNDFIRYINGTEVIGLTEEKFEECVEEMESRDFLELGLLRPEGDSMRSISLRIKLRPPSLDSGQKGPQIRL